MSTTAIQKPSVVHALEVPDNLRSAMHVFTQVEDTIRSLFGPENAVTLAKVYLHCLRTTPKLGQCSPGSLAQALMTCAELQLMPGQLGHIYLLPFGNAVTVVVGYKGLAELARRSGEIKEMAADVVYRDEFDSGHVVLSRQPPEVKHPFIPTSTPRKDEDIVAAYCVVTTKDGGRFTSILDRHQLDERRGRSPSRNAKSSPWVTDFAKMARKTAIRDLLQNGTVPLSAQMQAALRLEEPDTIDVGDLDMGAPAPQPPSSLRAALFDEADEAPVREPGEEG